MFRKINRNRRLVVTNYQPSELQQEQIFAKTKTLIDFAQELNDLLQKHKDPFLREQYNDAVLQIKQQIKNMQSMGMSMVDLYAKMGSNLLKYQLAQAQDLNEKKQIPPEVISENDALVRTNVDRVIEKQDMQKRLYDEFGINAQNLTQKQQEQYEEFIAKNRQLPQLQQVAGQDNQSSNLSVSQYSEQQPISQSDEYGEERDDEQRFQELRQQYRIRQQQQQNQRQLSGSLSATRQQYQESERPQQDIEQRMSLRQQLLQSRRPYDEELDHSDTPRTQRLIEYNLPRKSKQSQKTPTILSHQLQEPEQIEEVKIEESKSEKLEESKSEKLEESKSENLEESKSKRDEMAGEMDFVTELDEQEIERIEDQVPKIIKEAKNTLDGVIQQLNKRFGDKFEQIMLEGNIKLSKSSLYKSRKTNQYSSSRVHDLKQIENFAEKIKKILLNTKYDKDQKQQDVQALDQFIDSIKPKPVQKIKPKKR